MVLALRATEHQSTTANKLVTQMLQRPKQSLQSLKLMTNLAAPNYSDFGLCIVFDPHNSETGELTKTDIKGTMLGINTADA